MALSSIVMFVAAFGADGCSTPSTSSSSHWIHCSMNDDCTSVPGAVACREGLCVDVAGKPIAANVPTLDGGASGSGSGVSGGAASDAGPLGSAGGSGGGTGSATSGTAGLSSGTSGGSSAQQTSGTPLGSASGAAASGATSGAAASGSAASGSTSGGSDGGLCPAKFDDAFVDSLRTCIGDSDCVLESYSINCCGSTKTVGIGAAHQALFAACAPGRDDFPLCDCLDFHTTDDGRRLSRAGADVVVARCQDGHCVSRIAQRGCDKTVCAVGDLCVEEHLIRGGISTNSFRCAPSPCTGAVSCSCAQSVCGTLSCGNGGGEGEVTCIESL